jgi:hypothetical protein
VLEKGCKIVSKRKKGNYNKLEKGTLLRDDVKQVIKMTSH